LQQWQQGQDDLEYLRLLVRAEKADTHPGELIIKLAKRRGFDLSKVADKVDAAKADVDKARADLDRQRKAQNNASLGRLPGAGRENGVNVDAYLKASDKDKDAVFEKMRQQAKREGAY